MSSVVQRAGVSRSVFYKHFSGLDDLAVWVLSQAFARIREKDEEVRRRESVPVAELLRDDVTELVRHLEAHRRLYASVFNSSLGPRAAAAAQAAYIEQVHENLPNFAGGLAPEDVETDLVFFAGGLVALIVRWATDPDAEADTLIEEILARIPTWQIAESSATDGTH